MEDGKPLRGNEEWRSSKLLGSLLESKNDITRRCMLGNIAFQKFKKVWSQSNVPIQKKLLVYEAQVVSVIMYNCSSWAAPKNYWHKLDVCHRNHLRSIMNITWPKSMISNKTLYKRCNTAPLSEKAEFSRWKMLGHILRSDECSPAQTALCFAIETSQRLTGRSGRHRISLLQTLKDDLELRRIILDDYYDLIYLRELANDRLLWKKLFETKFDLKGHIIL